MSEIGPTGFWGPGLGFHRYTRDVLVPRAVESGFDEYWAAVQIDRARTVVAPAPIRRTFATAAHGGYANIDGGVLGNAMPSMCHLW